MFMGNRGDMGPVHREQGRYGPCSWGTGEIWVLFIRNGIFGSCSWGTGEIWAMFMGNRGDMGHVNGI
jgi:hypothetical protein